MRGLRLFWFTLVAAIVVAAPARLMAQCGVPTAYTLTPAATGSQNWTNASGSVWIPAGGFPGCTPGDTANVLGGMPITLNVNSSIPNALAALTLSTAGGTIDVLSGGNLTVAGPGTIAIGNTVKTSGGQFAIASGGAVTFQSGSTFMTSTGITHVQAGGQLNLDGTNTVGGGGTLTIDGTVTISTQLALASGALMNLNGATINGSSSIENSGLIEQNGADSTIAVPLNNLAGATGVNPNAGTLSLAGGGQGDAPFTLGGGTLDFPGGSYSMGTGGVVTGDGTLSITGGTLSIGGVTSPVNFFMNGGTLTGAGFLSVAGSFTWDGGTITGTGGTEIAGTGIGTFSGSAGTMLLDGRTFNDYGYVDFSATTNPLELSNDAVFAVYGTFDFTDDGSVTCNCATFPELVVSPNGSLVKSGGAGTSVIAPYTTNDAQITVLSGTLELAGDGFHTGAFYAASGTTLRFSAFDSAFDTSSSLSADGAIDFAAGSAGVLGSYSVSGLTSIADAFVYFANPADTVGFNMTAGVLVLDGPFTMSGTGTWSEGTIAGGVGTFKVASGATLTLDAATCVPTIAAIEFINDGTVNYTPTAASGNHLELEEATLTNNGTFDMKSDAPILEFFGFAVESEGGCGRSASARSRMPARSNGLFFAPSFINNNGVWKKTGAGTSDIEPVFTNTGTVLAQSGTMHFLASFTQTAGTTTVGPGDFVFDSPMTLDGGTLDGAGTIIGDVNNNSATVAPGNGTTGVITVSGNYSQANTGALAVGIAGPAAGQFDQLAVLGTATLGGAFTASLLNAYTPAIGTTWQVLTYASHSGSFASETLPPLVTSSSTPTAFVLQAIAPSADLSIGMTGPPSVNAAAPLSYVVTVTNNGPSSSSGTITVNNTLPAGVTGASGSGTGWTCNPPSGGVIACTTTATIAAAASLPTITFSMTAPLSGGSIQNSATVASSFDTNAANDMASVTTNVVAQADLQVAKSGPNSVIAGQNIVYTIVVTNNGPSSASGVTMSDPTPANTTFVSNSGACSTTFPCSLGLLAAGQSVTITSTFSTSPSFSGDVTNVSNLSSSTADPNAANDMSTKVTTVVANADLQITKTGPTSTTTNQTISYTITFINNGASPATSVVVSDPTPVGIAFVSNSGACATTFPCNLGTLNAGQSGTITSTYSIPANYSGASIVNTASISSAVTDPNGTNNSSTTTATIGTQADMQITKSGPNGVSAGQNIVYTIVVTNNGPTSASGVTVSDPTPANTTFVSNSGACSTAFPCNLGILTAGQTVTITSTFSTSPSFSGDVTNVASVSSSTSDPNAANNSSTKVTNVGAQSDLQITKTGPASTNVSQDITYTITFTNNGPSPATGVVVTDPMPAGLTFVSNSGACTTAFPCNLGTLTAGQNGTITATYNVPANYSGTSIANTASISSAVNDPTPANNSSTATTTVGPQTDLQITKTGPATTTPNQLITYTTTFTNNGPSTATNVVVSDPTPVGIAFISNSGACTTPFPCNIGTLTSGQSGTITSTYSVPANYSGASIANTASITSALVDPNAANNSSTATTTVTPSADVSITKTGPASVVPGQNIVYTVTVTNNGPSTATGVAVIDPTPADLTFVSNTGACTTAYPCSLGTLANGQSMTITSTYSVPSNYSGTSIANTATVTSASDANAANNTSTAVAPSLAQADLSITKSGPATFSAGQNIVYTITVTNNGLMSATNTFVSDPTPAGFTFVSNTGACMTPFPCSIGTISAFATATITATYNVPVTFSGTSVTNTASASTSAPESNPTNNSASTTANFVASAADVAITKTGPGGARLGDVITFTVVVTNNGPGIASNVVVSDPPPSGAVWISNAGACTTAFPCTLGTLAPAQSATITSTYRFMAAAGDVTNTANVSSTPADANTANNSASAVVSAGSLPTCPARAPSLLSPANGVVLNTASTVTFSWTSVANAIGYFLNIIPSGGAPQIVINTGTTSATVPLQPGPYAWFVSAAGIESCRPVASPLSSFTLCAAIASAPMASVVGESTTGQTFAVEWPVVDGATSYEIQESLSPAFTDPVISMVAENGKSFTKTAQVPIAYWYRVRALSSCDPTPGPFSTPIAVVVVPVPKTSNHDPNVNVPNGSHTPVTWQIFVPGLPEGTTSFIATVDRPWLSVSPTSGIIPPAGMNFTISADPTMLVNGTWTGTLIVVYGSTSVTSRVASDGTTTFTAPISISLVTPVTPTPLNVATNSAMIVPSVGHLAGIESLWRSDIRLANLAPSAQRFQLVFNPGTGGADTATKTTTITVDGGATTALDDIVRNWYGIGSLGNSSNGLLTVQPLDAAGKPLTGTSNVSAVSSRTFNASATGTLGQFVPAVPFAKFIGRGSAVTLQQIAQSDAYRTNLGIVEAAGKQVSVLVTAFDGGGAKLFELPLMLQAGEQKHLNGFLAANGVSSLANGRVEVRVTGGDGKVTAYASVVDNQSQDPILISGTAIDNLGASRYVVPGIADFTGGGSNWRSDMRVFNGGTSSQQATLTFYPSENGAPLTMPITIAAGEIRQLDDVLHSVLGVTNVGGALHVTTPSSAPLGVTARTYDQTSKGTLGQFIPAVTPNQAAGLGDRALQILQAEESSRYRTNIGVVEVTGKAAIAEISIHLPDSKVTPVLQIPLNAFESRQFPVLNSLGLGAVYNARLSVRVIGGEGRVTAYGSVIDMTTKDPTFIPAQ